MREQNKIFLKYGVKDMDELHKMKYDSKKYDHKKYDHKKLEVIVQEDTGYGQEKSLRGSGAGDGVRA